MEEKRELTKAEKQRAEKFEECRKEMAEKGYREENLTVSVVQASLMSFVYALPIIVVLIIPFWIFNDGAISNYFNSEGAFLGILISILVFVALIVVHELIHGITWSLFAQKGLKAISFGFIAEYLTPYCTCNEALKKWQYLLGTLMPTILLGIIPCVVAIFTGWLSVFVIGALMIFSGGGDLTISMKILLFEPSGKEVVFMDHPYQIGLVAFVK